MSEKVTINTEKPMNAYVEKSKKLSNVGLVIAHDVFGIDDDMRDRAEYWAAMGYTVTVPDLFSLEGAGSPLTAEDVDNTDRHRALCAEFNLEQGLKDIQAAVTYLRGQECHGVGVLGFGLGGLLAYLAAAKGECDAAISYCGPGIENHLADADAIQTPLSIYMAEEDNLIDADAQKAIQECFKGNQQVRAFVHPYVKHNFARWDSRHRDRCALTLAEHRAGEFFYMNLTLKHWQTRPKETASG